MGDYYCWRKGAKSPPYTRYITLGTVHNFVSVKALLTIWGVPTNRSNTSRVTIQLENHSVKMDKIRSMGVGAQKFNPVVVRDWLVNGGSDFLDELSKGVSP